jgi:hypothetical protein
MSSIWKNILPLLLLLFVGIIIFTQKNTSYVKSDLNNKEYLVQNMSDKERAAYMLSILEEKILMMRKHFLDNWNRYPKYQPFIERFCKKADKLFIYENSLTSDSTAYTVNKGEETVICLRSKRNFGELHDINIITYVTLHEISHIACTDINHTDQFKEVFRFFVEVASNIGIYTKINYQIDPKEYCGITVNDKL